MSPLATLAPHASPVSFSPATPGLFKKDIGPTYYPGDDYVDWVGGSAVPEQSFRDPVTIFGEWNEWASSRENPKPQLLWIGLRENPNDPTWKPRFLKHLETLISGPWSGVNGIIYYGSISPPPDNLDYRVDTSPASMAAIIAMGCNPHFATVDTC